MNKKVEEILRLGELLSKLKKSIKIEDIAPEDYTVIWVQIRPYFNDGDPCIFSLYDECIYYKDGEEEYDRNGEDSDFWFDLHNWKEGRKNQPQEVKDFISAMQVLGEEMEKRYDNSIMKWDHKKRIVERVEYCVE